jgi:hypothetical protein
VTGDPAPALTPAPPPDLTQLRQAQARQALLSSELPRVRAAAGSWRNGLAGLLGALAGFGLVRGRDDVATLAAPWAGVAGALLLAALLAGALGAVALLRAAHGRPVVVRAQDVLPAVVADHEEALQAARALRLGIALVFACTLLFVAAVGLTWYCPR